MNLLLMAVGAGLVGIAVVDLLWTTLWVDRGAGPVSARLSTAVWWAFRAVTGDRRLLSLAGPLLLVATIVTWVVLVWVGWTFVFASGEDVLIDTQNRGPITWSDRLYFVGYTAFTLGIGDFVPSGGLWQVATILTTANGMLLVTLGVSYVLSVIGAVVDKRSFAGTVNGLGRDAESFVRAGWNGTDLDDLDLPLDTLGSQLDRLANQHKAYPILHYYNPGGADQASSVAVVVFSEAVTLLRCGVPEEHRPNGALVESAHSSVQKYVETLGGVYIHPADDSPPPPDLHRLRESGVPTVSDEAFAEALADVDDHRRQLLGLVTVAGWSWPSGPE